MTLYQGRFLIARDKDGDVWAEPSDAGVAIKRGDFTKPDKGKLLLTIQPDQVARLAAWAQPSTLIVPFTGLLAKQVKELAQSVSLSPQSFVLEAVNAFLQAGEMASGGGHGHGHAHGGPPPTQDIRFEPPPK
jgi:hypothetical protein